MKAVKELFLPITLIFVLSISIYTLYDLKNQKMDMSPERDMIAEINTETHTNKEQKISPKYELEETSLQKEPQIHEKIVNSDIEILTDLESNMDFLNEVFKEISID